MRLLKPLLTALEVKDRGPEIDRIAKASGVTPAIVKYWNANLYAPSESQLRCICREFGVNPLVVKLRMGLIDDGVRQFLAEHAGQFAGIDIPATKNEGIRVPPCVLETEFGRLYKGDCIALMRSLPSGSFNLIFADPPFNLDKKYPSKINDALKSEDYLKWCFEWLDECIRLLADGGSLFVYNLPKWNTAIAEYLNARLSFRDWVAVDMKFSLPIPNRLYPSHYSLLYYAKGEKPRAFKPDRLPMDICPHCLHDLKDYGGYKDKMNKLGVSLTDVWNDIPPVRHKGIKKRKGANELSIKLLDRIIEFASNEGDTVFDPFGGSGSTYAVAEIKRRKWVGVEIGPVDEIIHRLGNQTEERERLAKMRSVLNCLFKPADKPRRVKLGLWTDETVKTPKLRRKPVDGSSTELLQLV